MITPAEAVRLARPEFDPGSGDPRYVLADDEGYVVPNTLMDIRIWVDASGRVSLRAVSEPADEARVRKMRVIDL